VCQRAEDGDVTGSLAVDEHRLEGSIRELSGFSSTSGEHGITRLAWSCEYRAAQRWLLEQMHSLGLRTHVDVAGNTWGRWEVGELPALVVGSHIDSVPMGGMYDGCLGVLAGLEVVRALQQAGFRPRRQMWLVAWAEEEGSATGAALLGSRAFTGLLPESERAARRTGAGPQLTQLLRDGEERTEMLLPDLVKECDSISAYLELHIEQGPVLEEAEVPIGVVSQIVGLETGSVRVQGEPNHAGGTPMRSRKDALVGASIIVQAVDRISRELGLCATVGELAVSPGASNVIPGDCELEVDARSESQAVLDSFFVALGEECAAVGVKRGLETHYSREYALAPTELDGRLQQMLRDTATGLGITHMNIVSGAGHDAMALATKVPTAMVFVPSRLGISHAPREYSSRSACGLGTSVLAEAAAELLSG